MTMEIKLSRFHFNQAVIMGLLAGLVCMTPFCVQAQADQQTPQNAVQYISPRLQLGLHSKPALDSPVQALISSGSPVEILKTQKDYSQIKTREGTQGWIKSRFLTPEEPAELTVKQLQESLTSVQQQLQTERAQRKMSPAQSDTLVPEAEMAQLQDKIADYEKTITDLNAELRAWEQLDSQDKKADKEKADQINKHLKERLIKIAKLATGQPVDASQLNLPEATSVKDTADLVQLPFLKTIKKDFLLNIVIGGISFFLGIFLMDLFNRRRHGGYRV